jgi:hypothetical protein
LTEAGEAMPNGFGPCVEPWGEEIRGHVPVPFLAGLQNQSRNLLITPRTPICHRPVQRSDSLKGGGYGDRIPVRAKISAPVQAGPGAQPAS